MADLHDITVTSTNIQNVLPQHVVGVKHFNCFTLKAPSISRDNKSLSNGIKSSTYSSKAMKLTPRS